MNPPARPDQRNAESDLRFAGHGGGDGIAGPLRRQLDRVAGQVGVAEVAP